LFSFDYPPYEGGIARLCAAIVTGLARQGPVRVLSQDISGTGPEPPAGPGITETRVTSKRPLRELAAWWRLLRNDASTVIVAGIWYPEGMLALLAGKRNVVIVAHGGELAPPEQRWRRALWKRLQRWTLEHATVVVANSHYTADMVRSVAPGASAVAIPLAVDHGWFAPGDREAARQKFGVTDPDTLVVCSVTRLEAYKGIDIVLRAISALPRHHRESLVYLVGGKGEALTRLQEEAASIGVAGNVQWLGFVPEADLPDLYRASDLFVLCTREQLDQRSVEGFGMVFLEAQACGTPVVGTRIGGIPDAVREGDGGWLIPDNDAAALSDVLCRLVENVGPFREAGRAARARVEREATWDHYMARFRDALARAGLDA
jgi:phosphatidylinositol alpha-1,6-mannosyltransferase